MLDRTPFIIGHRGACGYRPEHTLESYLLAIEMGVDCIEPDLVSTQDGYLIARHENDMTETTNVSDLPEFSNRKTTKLIDGAWKTGWFSEDFTLAEIKTLRAKERLDFRNQCYNNKWEIPTFQEILDLARSQSQKLGKKIYVYPETKHPSYFNALGLALEEPLVKVLQENGYTDADSPILIQSFEVSNLQKLNPLIDVPLVQLIDEPDKQPYDFRLTGDDRTYADLIKPSELAKISDYAEGLGVYKRLIVPLDQRGNLQQPTALIHDAHQLGLFVHAWTFRSEPQYLALDYQRQPEKEYLQFFELGIDGIFTDFPDTAVKVRKNAKS